MSRLDFCEYWLVDNCYDWKNDNCDECNIFKAYCEGARRAKNSIVKCKDCRWYVPKYKDKEYDCPQGLYAVYENDFCSHGERREPLPQYEEWQDEFNKMCESARPTTFVADEWYRENFGENNGK